MAESIRPDPTEVALRAAVRANLADALPRQVYADWLEEQPDPGRRLLAEYIRVETELANLPQDDPRGAKLIHHLIAVCERSHHTPEERKTSWWGRLSRAVGVRTVRPLGGWEYEADLKRVRQKIRALRRADPVMGLFGVALKRPVGETQLLAFEAKLGFLLPADYRAFLLHVGDGLVGPSDGLYPLQVSRNPDPLRLPFLFTREQAVRAGPNKPCEPRPSEEWLWFDECQREDGHLELCRHHDIEVSELLAVTGDTRGCMWISDMGLHLQRRADGTPETFLSWYEGWLDHYLSSRR